ncbi:MAG: diacylglycerol kinase family protein [Patescibacteria group bacterium]
MESKHTLFKSFSFAFEGFKVALIKGRNFKIQFILGVFACILGLILRLTPHEWAVLVITITLVLILELINTSLESIVNIVSTEIRNEAKIAKDVAAASVLIASIASVFIGLLLFLPKIF